MGGLSAGLRQSVWRDRNDFTRTRVKGAEMWETFPPLACLWAVGPGEEGEAGGRHLGSEVRR
jgi:hypothetical protein